MKKRRTALVRFGFALLATIGLVGLARPAQAAPFAYVTNNIGIVEVVDLATNTIVAKVPVSGGNIRGVTISPDGAFVYMASVSGNRIHVLDAATNAVVATVPVGRVPRGIAVTSDGAFVYVANQDDGTVSVIDTATNTVAVTVPVGTGLFGVAARPDGTRVYVTNGSANSVSVIDTATRTVIATIAVSAGARHIAVSPEGAFVYVGGEDNVSVIATATNAVVATVAVGQGTSGIAVTPNGALVYVANSFSNSVSVIDAATNTMVTSVSVGQYPDGVAVTPDGTLVYVANITGQTLSIVDTATNTVVGSVPLEFQPMVFGQFIGPARGQYPFTGFFSPVDNLPVVNRANAGQAVPLKFSLGGYRGLSIFAPASPWSQPASCSTGAIVDDIEAISTPGASGLQYDAATDTYTYVWKTSKSWKNSCRQLTVAFDDGSTRVLLFRFK